MDVRSWFPCIQNLHMPPDASSGILEWHRTSSANVGTLSPFTTQSCSHLTSYFCTFTVFVESNIFQYVLFFPSGTFFYNLFALIAFYIFFLKNRYYLNNITNYKTKFSMTLLLLTHQTFSIYPFDCIFLIRLFNLLLKRALCFFLSG